MRTAPARGPRRRERGGRSERDHDVTFGPLHWMAAGLFLATGAEAAARTPRGQGRTLRWAPLVLAPVGGAAHVARALRPAHETRLAAQLLDGLALGAAAAGVAATAYGALRRQDRGLGYRGGRQAAARSWLGALAPIAFGATGLLGLVLDQEESEDSAVHERLERRARIVERLVPRRRAGVERIVVHV